MRQTVAQWVLVALCLTWSGARAAPEAPELTVPSALETVGAELRDAVAELRRDGLPARMVVYKIREGAAKRIDPQRVLAAARAVAGDLRLVAKIARKQQVRPEARAAVIEAGVVAHRAGVALLAIDGIVGAAPREEPDVAVMALHAAADLAGRGYPRDAAAELVVLLIERDRRDAELPRVLAVVEAARKASGAEPAAALAEVARRVETGQDLQEAGRAAAGDGD